ncbi:hypothetical protein [Streptomyces sp. NPDC058620]|uniref:hypothetical protein n=1 Tax=Streptomyces sp. NPDC058620 TaxID=3346560 RepID=UPI003655D61D
MTRNRTVKQANRRRAATQNIPYTLARQQWQEPLFEGFGELENEDTACCWVFEDLAAGLNECLACEGTAGLAAEVDRLAKSMLSRDSHYTYGSSHGVLMTVEAVCLPLLSRNGIKSSAEGEIVWREPTLSGADHALGSAALRGLEGAAHRAWAANAPY